MNYKLIENNSWQEVEINGLNESIPTHWEVSRFDNFGIFKTGKDYKHIIGNLYPVYGSSETPMNVLTNKFIYNQPTFIIGRKGTIDNPFKIDKAFWCVDTAMFFDAKNVEHIDFLYYQAKKIDWLKYNSGSTVPSLVQSTINKIEFACPDTKSHQFISLILSKQESIILNIKKLIQHNELIFNELSEQLLSGILRLKNDNGDIILYKNPDNNWRNIEINGELKDIPSNWDIQSVDQNFKFQKGKPPQEKQKNLIDNSYQKYLSMDVIRDNSKDIIYTNKGLSVKKGDLGILWDGSNAGEIFTIKENGFLSSTIALIITKKDIFSKNFSFYLFKDIENKIREKNQGGAIPHVDGNFLRNFLIKIPSNTEQELIAGFMDNQEKNIINLKQLLNKEKEKFEWLLENLLSGKYLVEEE